MRLKYQLFLTLLLSSIVLIALMAAYNSWSFDRGFTNFVVENEKQRLQPVVASLKEAYAQDKSWDWIEEQPEKMRELLRLNGRGAKARRSDKKNRNGGPARSRTRLLLVDESKRLLFGRNLPSKNVVWQPIDFDGDTIGYLGIREPKGLPGELESVFAAQQLRNYGYTAVAMILLSALLAIALASRIIKPMLKVNKAVGHITGGEYQYRIDSERQDEIGDLSRNINQMAYTLEKNQNARQQWMAEISHELRTPVAILQGELEAIQDGIRKLDDSAVSSLYAESVRLGRLIDDLHELSLSDIGAMNYHLETTDLGEVLKHRLEAGSSLISQANLSVALQASSEPIEIQADPQRLAQLIDNLLQNSVRYTDEGGEIVINLSRESGNVVLDWADSTPGVTDEQLPNLFSPLYRAEQSRNREHGGSGLGLAIVEKIVTAHEGKIQAFHSAQGGLRVQVSLPV